MTAFETRNTAVVSTTHITHGDKAQLVDAVYDDNSSVSEREGGYLIELDPMASFLENLSMVMGYDVAPYSADNPMSDPFVNLINHLWGQGFDMLILDKDGPVYDDLPKYTW